MLGSVGGWRRPERTDGLFRRGHVSGPGTLAPRLAININKQFAFHAHK